MTGARLAPLSVRGGKCRRSWSRRSGGEREARQREFEPPEDTIDWQLETLEPEQFRFTKQTLYRVTKKA